MASPSRVALIFGAGSNIGASLVKGFLGAGYRVATVSRSQPPADANVHAIQADLSDPQAVPGVLAQLASAGLAFPSVMIWNAASASPPEDPANPLEESDEGLGRDLDLMVRSPYAAAREAVRAWKQSGDEGRKGTFIMTGNMLNKQILPVPTLVGSGVGKSGAYYWVALADATFREKGIRFFYADERTAEGGPVVPKPHGDGHAEVYLSLTQDDEGPSYFTFVGGKYREFP